MNISFEETVSRIGKNLADRLRDTSLELYRRAVEHAAKRGIIIADTIFEFGLLGDELIWIDEALTPDSSIPLIGSSPSMSSNRQIPRWQHVNAAISRLVACAIGNPRYDVTQTKYSHRVQW